MLRKTTSVLLLPLLLIACAEAILYTQTYSTEVCKAACADFTHNASRQICHTCIDDYISSIPVCIYACNRTMDANYKDVCDYCVYNAPRSTELCRTAWHCHNIPQYVALSHRCQPGSWAFRPTTPHPGDLSCPPKY